MPAARLLRTLKAWLRRGPRLPPELQAARDVIAAIDSGGLPLDTARINRIARELGLEVSPKAPVEETLGRLRAAVDRGLQNLAMQEAAKPKKGDRK
ncbi:MAG: hypothetical protein OEL20_03700 [Sulfuritalea sp.]|jgi:hypothetical protein|nr:hypothetical protein [Sulfuritalea sp.]